MTTKNYYPLPAASSGPPVSFGIKNMWDSIPDASDDPIERATGNPSGGLSLQFGAVVGGGVQPYTYAWSAGDGQIAISDQTVSNPVFSAFGTGSPSTKDSSFSLTVTDSSTPTPLTDEKFLVIRFHFGTSNA